MVPIRVRAMVLAGETLAVAGPPDKIVQGDPLAAFEGRAGGVLQLVSATDGKIGASVKLPSPPAFDAMSVAQGRIYMSTLDRKLKRYRMRRPRPSRPPAE